MSEEVKFKHSLQEHFIIFSLIKKISVKVREIENFEELKLNPDLVEYICKCIEEEIADKKIKKAIDKKQMVVNIMAMTFDLSEDEKKFVGDLIDYQLCHKLIKKKSFLAKSLSAGKKYLFKF